MSPEQLYGGVDLGRMILEGVMWVALLMLAGVLLGVVRWR